MYNGNEIRRGASSEIEKLRTEVEELRDLRKQLTEQIHVDKMHDRKLPPMSQLTRTQKRYFLEPWFTTIWIGTWGAAVPMFIAAIWTPWHWQFAATALLLVLIGVAASVAKYWHQDANVRTEGQLLTPPKSRDYY